MTLELIRKNMSNYLDEVEVFWDQFLAIVHDENTSDIQFDIVLLFLVFKQIEGRPLGDKQKCTEFELSFNAEIREKKSLIRCLYSNTKIGYKKYRILNFKN